MPKSLQDQIDSQRQTIHAEGYPISVGELANLYRDGDLQLRPAFQRFYRWTPEQKSRLIESLLLGIPIPSIFVSQRDDGVWDVIDGLQRLSAIFEFMGILRDRSNGVKEPLTLLGTEYLPELNNKTWQGEDEQSAFTDTQQRLIKRSSLDVKILLRESSPTSKYELFQRLNTGGTPLSDQEVRNCIVIMDRPDVYDDFESFSRTESFINATSLTDRAIEERYDLELVSRWIVFRRTKPAEAAKIDEMSTYLTKRLIEIIHPETFDLKNELAFFGSVFDKLYATLQDGCFRKYDTNQRRRIGGFSVACFEVLAIGLGRLETEALDIITPDDVQRVSEGMWQAESMEGKLGMGVRASTRVPATLTYGEEAFRT